MVFKAHHKTFNLAVLILASLFSAAPLAADGKALVGGRLIDGFGHRPLADSVRDIHDWWYSDAVQQERRERMESGPRSLMAREAEIIAAWRAR